MHFLKRKIKNLIRLQIDISLPCSCVGYNCYNSYNFIRDNWFLYLSPSNRLHSNWILLQMKLLSAFKMLLFCYFDVKIWLSLPLCKGRWHISLVCACRLFMKNHWKNEEIPCSPPPRVKWGVANFRLMYIASLVERSSLPSKNFPCISTDMLQRMCCKNDMLI